MAQGTSPVCEAKYRFPNMAKNHFLIRLRPLTLFVRKWIRKLASTASGKEVKGAPVPTDVLEEGRALYRDRGWLFMEGFWEKDFHKSLVDHWPAKCFFDPPRYITKSYDYGSPDFGFQWTPESADVFPKEFPAVARAYAYLSSEEFTKRLTDFCGDNMERECVSLLITRAFSGSSVISHMDSANVAGTVNLVTFVDGTGGPNAGGLAIWEDNEFKKLVFEPTNLTNSAMIYNMSSSFYHGFEPMRPGTYRWMLAACFNKKSGE